LLAGIKASLTHGQWLPWLKGNIPFAERTARNYMRCHAERDRLKSANVADLGEAYRLLSPPPDNEPETKTPEQLISEAAKLFSEAHDQLQSECQKGDLSPEDAAALSRAVTVTKARAKDMLENQPGLSFHKLLFAVGICDEMECLLKDFRARRAAA
jgi:hypothetical protein